MTAAFHQGKKNGPHAFGNELYMFTFQPSLPSMWFQGNYYIASSLCFLICNGETCFYYHRIDFVIKRHNPRKDLNGVLHVEGVHWIADYFCALCTRWAGYKINPSPPPGRQERKKRKTRSSLARWKLELVRICLIWDQKRVWNYFQGLQSANWMSWDRIYKIPVPNMKDEYAWKVQAPLMIIVILNLFSALTL